MYNDVRIITASVTFSRIARGHHSSSEIFNEMIFASPLDFTLFTCNYICLIYIGIDCNANICIFVYLVILLLINIHTKFTKIDDIDRSLKFIASIVLSWHAAIECTLQRYLDPCDW